MLDFHSFGNLLKFKKQQKNQEEKKSRARRGRAVQDEEKAGGRRFPGAQVARPRLGQREMAEELHMMQCPLLQCHDSG